VSRRISSIALLVPDYDQAIAWYTAAFGFALLEDTDLGWGKRRVRVGPAAADGTDLLLARATTDEQRAAIGRQAGGRVFLFLQTDDVWAELDRLRQHGVEPESPPRHEAYGTVAVVADPYGNCWDLISPPVAFDVVDPRSPAAEQVMRAYFTELDDRLGLGLDHEAELAAAVPDYCPPGGAFVLVRVGSGLVGCGAVRRLDERTAEVKRMWIDPGHRRRGLAQALIAHLVDLARATGAARLVLDTSADLPQAVGLYTGAGFVPVPAYNDNPHADRWFGMDL
jgi:GNAT superfamily N-acetyltransferase